MKSLRDEVHLLVDDVETPFRLYFNPAKQDFIALATSSKAPCFGLHRGSATTSLKKWAICPLFYLIFVSFTFSYIFLFAFVVNTTKSNHKFLFNFVHLRLKIAVFKTNWRFFYDCIIFVVDNEWNKS